MCVRTWAVSHTGSEQIPTTTVGGKHYEAHFTDGETEAWRVHRLFCLLPRSLSPPQLSNHRVGDTFSLPGPSAEGAGASLCFTHFSFIKVSSCELGQVWGRNSLRCLDSDRSWQDLLGSDLPQLINGRADGADSG